MKDLRHDLEQRKAQGLYRVRRVSEGPQGPELRVGGERLLAFCSNDYLGLANHPEVVRALQDGADAWGVGSGAAAKRIGMSATHGSAQ